jgi:eukaryotic-like serine/threonine-protein kinase
MKRICSSGTNRYGCIQIAKVPLLIHFMKKTCTFVNIIFFIENNFKIFQLFVMVKPMGKIQYQRFIPLLKHIALVIVSAVVFIWISLKIMDIYTNHGKTYVVSDFTGLKFDEIVNNPSNNTFQFVLVDSIFDNNREKGTVVSQTPLPNSNVKKNRKVYLTIVASQPEMIACPNLQDLTVRQATTVLETYGVSVGKIEFVPDIGNTVIRWKQMGKTISPGDKLVKGSRVDLVVGSGDGIGNTYLPNLVGKSKDEARSIITGAGLNIGGEFYLNPNDTTFVFVVKQNPPYSDDFEIRLGSIVDLWYE